MSTNDTVKHTPGPWVESPHEYNPEDSSHTGWIDGPNGTNVCRYAGCGSHQAEWPNPLDFRLALAAPDLLAALDSICYSISLRFGSHDGSDDDAWAEAVERHGSSMAHKYIEIRKLLARVRGGEA